MTIAPTPPATPVVGANKSIAAVASGAIMTIIAYAIGAAWNIHPPAEVMGAAQTLVTLIAVYCTPHGG